MKKDSKRNIIIIVVISAIIIVLLYYFLMVKQNKSINFKIKNNNIQVKLGETKKIEFELSDPNLKIEWMSSNSAITINSIGEVKANNYGNTVITGIVRTEDNTYTETCNVIAYSGEIGVELEKIDIPEGYLLMAVNSEYYLPITLVPNNAYITSINYSITDENVAIIENDKIIAKNQGTTELTATYNNLSTNLTIKVSNDVKETTFAKEVKGVTLSEDNITMEMGDTKKISYEISPQDGHIDNIKWTSSNEDVVSIIDGEIKAINKGEAIVKIIVNDNITDELNITVKASNADIVIDYNPKTTIRIGENTTIKSHLEPAVNEIVNYKSSNPGVASVSNGVITGVSAGSSTITLSLNNGKTKTFTINVLPQKGFLEGAANFWGYKSLNAKTPTLANEAFFQSLAQNGIGIVQGGNYIITIGGESYTYDITNNTLSVSNKKIKMRLYYPKGEDLSTLNTLVYMGGRGETNFGGVFSDFQKDPSLIKSGGIIALIAEGKNFSFNGESAAYVTKFMKAITKQQEGVKNSLLGFSDGAHQVLDGDKYFQYNTLVIFSGYVDYVSTVPAAKNSEIIFIIAANDGNYRGVKTAINQMKNNGFTNVMAVTNATDLGVYENSFLLHINPGKLMKFGHFSENVLTSGIIEYLND